MTDAKLLEFTTLEMQHARQTYAAAVRKLIDEIGALSNTAAELAAAFSLAAATARAIKDIDSASYAHAWSCAGALACLGASTDALRAQTTQVLQDAVAVHGQVGTVDRCIDAWSRECSRARTTTSAPPELPNECTCEGK